MDPFHPIASSRHFLTPYKFRHECNCNCGYNHQSGERIYLWANAKLDQAIDSQRQSSASDTSRKLSNYKVVEG